MFGTKSAFLKCGRGQTAIATSCYMEYTAKLTKQLTLPVKPQQIAPAAATEFTTTKRRHLSRCQLSSNKVHVYRSIA